MSGTTIFEALVNPSLVERPLTGASADSAGKQVSALTNVLNFIITDSFDLNSEESLWVGYHLGAILAPLHKVRPSRTMLAVSMELDTGEYTNRMMNLLSQEPSSRLGTQRGKEERVKAAPLSTWVEDISEMILLSYPDLRPMLRSAIVGSLHGLFTELGVTDNPAKSRPSTHLPTSVRHTLAANELD